MARVAKRSTQRGNPSDPTTRPCRRRSSFDVPIHCDGYIRMKKKSALTWHTRFVVLRGRDLRVYYSKDDADAQRNAIDTMMVEQGKLCPRHESCVEWTTRDGREILGRLFNRAELAKWITVFYRIALRASATSAANRKASLKKTDVHVAQTPEEELVATLSSNNQEEDAAIIQKPPRRRVSFYGSVLVRTIPALAQEQIAELFYSREEMEKFSAQASSLLCRTEEAVNAAYLSLRRPSFPVFRKQQAAI